MSAARVVTLARAVLVCASLLLTTGLAAATQCHDCAGGSSGPCMNVANNACYGFYAGTTMCPAGTAACDGSGEVPAPAGAGSSGSPTCKGCWPRTQGACQGPDTVCYGYMEAPVGYAGPPRCPPGTAECKVAGSQAPLPTFVVDTEVGLTQSELTDDVQLRVASAVALTAGVPPTYVVVDSVSPVVDAGSGEVVGMNVAAVVVLPPYAAGGDDAVAAAAAVQAAGADGSLQATFAELGVRGTALSLNSDVVFVAEPGTSAVAPPAAVGDGEAAAASADAAADVTSDATGSTAGWTGFDGQVHQQGGGSADSSPDTGASTTSGADGEFWDAAAAFVAENEVATILVAAAVALLVICGVVLALRRDRAKRRARTQELRDVDFGLSSLRSVVTKASPLVRVQSHIVMERRASAASTASLASSIHSGHGSKRPSLSRGSEAAQAMAAAKAAISGWGECDGEAAAGSSDDELDGPPPSRGRSRRSVSARNQQLRTSRRFSSQKQLVRHGAGADSVHSVRGVHSAHSARSLHSAGRSRSPRRGSVHSTHSAYSGRSVHSAHSGHSAHSAHSGHSGRSGNSREGRRSRGRARVPVAVSTSVFSGARSSHGSDRRSHSRGTHAGSMCSNGSYAHSLPGSIRDLEADV